MALYLIPHSSQWFEALQEFNPHQAFMTGRIIQLAGREDVCSICGDSPAKDYKLVGERLAPKAVATLRLCDDCLKGRGTMYGETFQESVFGR